MKSTDIKNIFEKNRSYRRFRGDLKLTSDILEDIISVNRFVSSGGNMQRLRFMPVCDADTCDKIFPSLKWAGYLKDWDGPVPGERPTGYIFILAPKDASGDTVGIDVGLSAQAMLSYATTLDIGGCMLLSFNRQSVEDVLGLDKYTVKLVIALGYPLEKVVITDAVNGDIKYYRDENMVHYVPKLKTEDIIFPPCNEKI